MYRDHDVKLINSIKQNNTIIYSCMHVWKTAILVTNGFARMHAACAINSYTGAFVLIIIFCFMLFVHYIKYQRNQYQFAVIIEL